MAVIEDNRIIFDGILRGDPRGALVCMHQLASIQRAYSLLLDFSSVTFADAVYMLPIASYAAYYRFNGIECRLVPPNLPSADKLFANTNWSQLIDPTHSSLRVRRIRNNLPALQFTDSDSHFNVVNKAMDILLETISVADRKQFKALEWSINEVTDNVINHAESPIGGIIQIQCNPVKNTVSFYVVDSGLGISKTLRDAKPEISSDPDALDRAIREGVTRNATTNQGNGLFGTFKCCEVSSGDFYIRANHASLAYNERGLRVRNDAVPFRGSFIGATINYGTPRLLERAFVFRGRIHEPANDYIDTHYEQQDEMLVFALAKESEGFGSREYGRRTRTKIDNLLVDRANRIMFDFTDVPLVSSSFADETFGKLFSDLGPVEFARRCSFQRVDATVQRLLDRSIMLRMKAN